jgi:hypothetical protein
MSQPDDRPPEEPTGSSDVEPKLDEDAVWAEIVAHYGDRPEMGSPGPDDRAVGADPDLPDTEEPAQRSSRKPRNIFDRAYLESTTEPTTELSSEATWDDEGHFVPPVPPPLPTLEPRRKLAWIGMFGAPALMLLAVVFGWHFPNWLGTLLVGSFVGGFVYLVATMPRRKPGDWSGDDGAVV